MARSYYDVLLVQPTASPDEIKEAYRALAWKTQSEGGQDALKEINAAFAVLSNPDRRAEYDRALADGTVAAAYAPTPAPAAPAPAPAAAVPSRFGTGVKADGPGFHPFLRLWGGLCGLSYFFFKVRYAFIPMSLILGVAAIFGVIASANGYLAAPDGARPHRVSINEVVKGNVKGNDYVTVTGTVNRDLDYVQSSDSAVTHYYALISGNTIILVKGKNLSNSGPYTGQLQALDTGLQNLAKEDAPKLAKKGYTFATTRYLNLDFTPTPPRTYLIWLVILSVGALVMLIPPLFRFSMFRSRRGEPTDLDGQGPQWPVQAWGTGRFSERTTGKRSFEAGVPGFLMRTGNPEWPLEVGYDRMGRVSQQHFVIAIPAGSAVSWGYDYGGGKPRPALTFRKNGQVIRVCISTEAHARWIAAAFATGNLNG
ncbi:MAG TPA: J domain-containing protein [Symbiobacteriaceae bacterium]|nr:J domain-containing protein [Symbiobacteriaceae bacterium]